MTALQIMRHARTRALRRSRLGAAKDQLAAPWGAWRVIQHGLFRPRRLSLSRTDTEGGVGVPSLLFCEERRFGAGCWVLRAGH